MLNLTTVAGLSFMTSNMMVPIVLGHNLQHREATVLISALSAYPIAQVLFLPFLGALADKIGKKKIMLCCTLINAILYVAHYFAIVYGAYKIFIILRFLCGATDANIALSRASLAEVAPKGLQARCIGFMNSAKHIGYAIGPMIILLMVSFYGVQHAHVFLLISLFYSLAFFCLLYFFQEKITQQRIASTNKLLPSLAALFQTKAKIKTIVTYICGNMPADMLYLSLPLIYTLLYKFELNQVIFGLMLYAIANFISNIFFVPIIAKWYSSIFIIRFMTVLLCLLLVLAMLLSITSLYIVFIGSGLISAVISAHAALIVNDKFRQDLGKIIAILSSTRMLISSVIFVFSAYLVDKGLNPMIFVILLSVAYLVFTLNTDGINSTTKMGTSKAVL